MVDIGNGLVDRSAVIKGWHHWHNMFEQISGDSEGQGSVTLCSPWDCKESDMT